MKHLSIIVALFGLTISSNSYASIQFQVNNQQGTDSLSTEVLVENMSGDLKFTVTIVDATNTGDLRGIFFHVADASLLPGLSATATGIGSILGDTQTYSENSVQKTGAGGNPNINPLGPFDAGIELGTGNGVGGADDLQTVMFLLSHTTDSLDVNTFFPTSASVGGDGFVMGIRGQSVGPASGSRGGSSKQGGGDPIPMPDPNNQIPEPTSFLVWSLLAVAVSNRASRRTRA